MHFYLKSTNNRGEIATMLTFTAVVVLLLGIAAGRRLAPDNTARVTPTPIPTVTRQSPTPIPIVIPAGEQTSLGMTASQYYEAFDRCRKTIGEAGIVPCYTGIFNRITSGSTCSAVTKLSAQYCTLNLVTKECLIQCVIENVTL